jgi:hypothetical protein
MLRNVLLITWCMLLAGRLAAAEKVFDFTPSPTNALPTGFVPLLSGGGAPGEWKLVLEDIPSVLPAFTTRAPVVSKKPVLTQVSRDATDERFPLLVYTAETFRDFTFTTRFKIVEGVVEQMAGVVFRLQNATNFYVLRANAKDGNLRFYKVVDGQRGNIIGPAIPIMCGLWYDLTVDCKGNQIRCLLNGKEAMPTLKDNTFATGKVGFWTKSDSVSCFAEARINYIPLEPFAQVLVRETLSLYPRLLGLNVFLAQKPGGETKLVASTDPKQVGQPGGKTETDILARGRIYTHRGVKDFTVYMPLHDRNGDIVGVVHITMDSFLGQTEQNAIARALPIIKTMETKIQSSLDFLQ